jgi:hypothetical protein
MELAEVKVLIPQDRVAEFYGLTARFIAGDPQLEAPARGTRRPRRSRGPSGSSYAPIGKHLKDAKGSETNLSFGDIESILGRKLPTSAYRHRAWWANTDTHSQALTWLSAGWRVDTADLDKQEVHFVRE